MILKQNAFQKIVQIMKLKENQEKSATLRYRTRMHNKNSVCTERNRLTPNPLGRIVFDIPERYNLYSISGSDKLFASKQKRDIL